LPAGLASLLGGLLLTYLPIGHVTHQTTTVKVTPASPQMMQLLRDEHGLIVDFIKEQAANEKSRGGGDQAQRAVSEAVAPAASQVASQVPPPPLPHPNSVAASMASKPAAPRSKNPVVATATPTPAAPASAADTSAPPAAHADDSLLAKTIGIKDRVLSATQHAVSATFGAIPSWFGSVGDRLGGEGQSPRPPADLVSASWSLSGAADR